MDSLANEPHKHEHGGFIVHLWLYLKGLGGQSLSRLFTGADRLHGTHTLKLVCAGVIGH